MAPTAGELHEMQSVITPSNTIKSLMNRGVVSATGPDVGAGVVGIITDLEPVFVIKSLFISIARPTVDH
jgi:hypothetical protein